MSGREHSEDEQRMSQWKLAALTAGLAGCQCCWGIQIGVSTKVFLEFGMPREVVSLAWLSGPVSGMLMQPIIGAWSDRFESRWGKRRPFIFAGLVFIIFSLLLFSNADVIGQAMGDAEECLEYIQDSAQPGDCPAGLTFAIIGFIILDFSINTVQGPLRTFLTDSIPPVQQADGNAWFAVMASLGNFCGYILGFFTILDWIPGFKTETRALYTIAAVFCVITISLSLSVGDDQRVKKGADKANKARQEDGRSATDFDSLRTVSIGREEQLSSASVSVDGLSPKTVNTHPTAVTASTSTTTTLPQSQPPPPPPSGLFRRILHTMKYLPKPVLHAFIVQCFTWFALFMTFIYFTDWVGQEIAGGDPNGDPDDVDRYREGVDKGNLGLAAQSLLAMVYSMPLPRVKAILPMMLGRFGFKRVYCFSQLVQGLALLLCWLAAGLQLMWLALALITVQGITWATTMTVPWAITGIAVDGLDDRGTVMAVMNMSQCFPEILAALVGTLLVQIFGNTTACLVLGGLSGLGGACAIVFLNVGDSCDKARQYATLSDVGTHISDVPSEYGWVGER